LLIVGIYEVCREMASCGMIYIPSFMKLGIGVQAILRFFLGNFNGWDGRDLRITSLIWD
jgi:hypothetical protein